MLIQQIRANLRHLKEVIKREPLIESWKEHYNRFRIHYITGISETWFKHSYLEKDNDSIKQYLIPEDPFKGRKVTIKNLYPYDPFDPNNEFIIKSKDWHKGNFLDKRLSMQRILVRLIREGWKDIHYPKQELINDFKRMAGYDLNKYYSKQSILRGNFTAGRMIMEHFFPWGKFLREPWDDQTKLFFAIRKQLLHHKPVTRFTIARRLMSQTVGFIRQEPNYFRAIFRHFGIKDMVVADPYPEVGSKAVAALFEGCEYHTDCNYLDKLFGFLGANGSGLHTREHYDCAIIYPNNTSNNRNELEKWRTKADFILVYVPDNLRNEFPRPLGRVHISNRYRPGWIYHYG